MSLAERLTGYPLAVKRRFFINLYLAVFPMGLPLFFMKKYIPYTLILILGIVIGWLWRGYHFTFADDMVRRDTTIVYEKIPYSRLDLSANTMKLDVPKIGTKELVYIETSSLDTIYRDSVRYVTMPREYFYTKVEDAEIWHSGIDSRIDSLNVLISNTTVTEVVNKKSKKNAISIGIEANYSNSMRFPLHAEYSYKILPWLSVYGYGEYEFCTKQLGVGVGASFTIEY